jgi:hypothetical protein
MVRVQGLIQLKITIMQEQVSIVQFNIIMMDKDMTLTAKVQLIMEETQGGN